MRTRWLPLLILLWAAGLRLIGLTSVSPPGLSHDEVANWLIDRSILAGRHTIYFTEAYGHEAGFHYWQTLLVALVGDHALALRLAAAFLGLLLVAVTYALTRRLFNRPIALLNMAIIAAHFWPVFYSRQALRAISLPVTAGLALLFLWQYLFPTTHHPSSTTHHPPPTTRSLLLAAFFAAMSTYTYMASRALPFLLAGWLLYLIVFHAQTIQLKRIWPGLLAFGVVYGALSWPLVAFIRRVPTAEARIAEVDGPLRALMAGDVGPVWHNALAIAGMFGLQGDPLWRQNVAGMAVFAWPMALLFYAGVVYAIWRWRTPRYALLLIWAAAAALPSLLTVDAPSSIRMILFLPLSGLFPAIVIHRLSTLSTVFPQLSTENVRNLGITVLTISFLLFSGGRTIYQLGVVWPQNEEVAFVWQRDLTAAAAYLDERPQLSAATIVGWTPDTMDEPTMAVSRQRDDVQLRFTGRVGAVTTVVIPAAADGAAVVIRPSILPFEPALAEALARQGVEMAQPAEESIVVYRWTAPFAPRPAIEQTAVFADQLRLTGYEVQGDCGQTATPFCFVVSYWEVVGETADERRFFLHMVDESGEIIAQSDALDAPARYWRVGDQLLQVHALPTSSFSHALRLGVYDPRPPYAPLMTEEGVSFVTLSTKD